MIFFFDKFELDTDKFEFRRSGEILPIEPQTFLVLKFLIENRTRMISRDELTREIWAGRAISDWAISGAIKSARQAIGDVQTDKRRIRTIYGKGFRFLGDVATSSSEPHEASGSDRGQNIEGKAGQADGASIAVLPFSNLGPGTGYDYFADGITEDLITDLARIPGLSVASRNAAFGLKGDRDNLSEIGRTLQVRYVLQGSLRHSGTMLRINARLVDVSTDGQLWAERFDGSLDEVFVLQDRITARVLTSMRQHVAEQFTGVPHQGTQDPTAYDFCLRGRSEYYLYTPDHLAKALSYFEQAAEKDPAYAEAYAYQSYCRTAIYVFAWPGSDNSLDRALSLAEKAVTLDPGSSIAHARLGWVLGYLDRPEDAAASFDVALSKNSQNADVLYAYGETMNRLGEPERALQLLDQAFSIDTFVPPSWEFAKGHSQILLRNYGAALSHILPVLERVPRFIPARVQLARLHAEMGETDKAEEIVGSIREHAPRYSLATARRMFPYPQLSERKRLIDALSVAGLPE